MKQLRASACVVGAVLVSVASSAGQDKPPAPVAPLTLPVTCMVLAAVGAPAGPAPGTTLPVPAPFVVRALIERLKADYKFAEVAMAGTATFELGLGGEQRCPGRPGGPFVLVDLVGPADPDPVVRLRIATAAGVQSETTVTLPPSGPTLVAAGGDAERYFVLVGKRRMPPPGAAGPGRWGAPGGGQAPAVLQRVDPVLPEGTPPIENDLLAFLEVSIDAAGEVAGLRLLNGPPSLAEPVIEAVRRWKFRKGEPLVSILGLNLRCRGRASAEPAAAPGRGDVPPVKVRDVKPRYPAEAQRNRVQGVVVAEARVDADGIVTDAFAIRPVAGLTQATVEAVMGWRFAPRPGQPPIRMTITQNYSLQ